MVLVCFGMVVVCFCMFWYGVRMVLVLFWYEFGMVLVWFWYVLVCFAGMVWVCFV